MRKLEGHAGGARSVAFDQDGETIAAAGESSAIRIWDVDTGRLRTELTSVVCNDVAFSPRGGGLASGHDDSSARIWDVHTRELLHELGGHDGFVMTVAYNHEGALLATASKGGVIRLWDAADGELLHSEKRARLEFSHVAFHPDGQALASGGQDGVLMIWDVASWDPVATLEGHTDLVRCVSYTPDGRLLASKSYDNTIRIWEAATGAPLAVVDTPGKARWSPGLAFHPRQPLLAAAAAESPATADMENLVQIWEFDTARLLARDRASSIAYTSAKIVLLGESGVGKTGLAWRLAHGDFIEHSSTHGQQFWTLDQLRGTRSDGAQCEAILWDLAGQPDYRLIHALFLDDADLALVLFDPTRDEDPLRGVEYWLRQLGVGGAEPDRGGPEAILVSARTDRGTGRLTAAEIEAFCRQRGVGGYVATSALKGDGVGDLLKRMRGALDWDASPVTVTTATFKRIKDYVLALKEVRSEQVVLSSAELRERLERETEGSEFSDAEMLSAVGHLANHGYVTKLRTSRGESRILLAPELLNNVASSIVLEARRNEKGLGSLEEMRVLSGEYDFPEIRGLSRADRDVLLDSAVAMFLHHQVCFRETDPLSSRVYLVFPELINLKKPAVDDDESVDEGVSYTVAGQVQNVYASLVVLLGYTSTFTRTHQWSNQARYVMGDGLVCGFRLEHEREGELDFVLYYGATVGAPVRMLFQSLFESFLARRDLDVQRYEPVTCPNGHRLNRAVVREHVGGGDVNVFCSKCGSAIVLPMSDGRIELTQEQAAGVQTLHQIADRRVRFEQALFRFKTYVTESDLESPDCFVSYAWGEGDHERWVQDELAIDLVKAGIDVILDRWENARIGASVARFVERAANSARVVVVGTPLYREKYDNGKPMGGFAVAAEGDLIGKRMMGSEGDKRNVLPVLKDGAEETSLPPLLQGRVYADFRDPAQYFVTAFDLITSLYGIDAQDPVCLALRKEVADATTKGVEATA